MITASCPILRFAAYSGTGKTTLLEKLIPLLTAQGIRIGMIKHAHHDFDIDKEGKDSYRLRHAGAGQMLIASKRRWALMVETPRLEGDPDLQQLIDQLDQSKLDLILVEGFKHVPFAKIELHREATSKPFLHPDDNSIIAIASDNPASVQSNLPVLSLNVIEEICRFVQDYLKAG